MAIQFISIHNQGTIDLLAEINLVNYIFQWNTDGGAGPLEIL